MVSHIQRRFNWLTVLGEAGEVAYRQSVKDAQRLKAKGLIGADRDSLPKSDSLAEAWEPSKDRRRTEK